MKKPTPPVEPILITGLRPVDRYWARQLGVPAQDLVDPKRVAAVRVDRTWAEVRVGEWAVAYRLAAQDGAPVVAELRIFPHEPDRPREHAGEWSAEVLGVKAAVPPGGITARLLRRVRLGEHHKVADRFLQYLHQTLEGGPGGFGLLVADALEQRGFRPRARTTARRGRPRRPDLFYAQLAQEYVAALERGSRRPVEDVAGRRGLTAPQVRDYMHAARNRGLLTRGPRQQGRFGGTLTPRARALLRAVRRGRRPRARRARRG